MSLLCLDPSAYTIGWICALPKEMTAAIATLDTIHEGLSQPASDYNNYCLGSVGNSKIVIASLPSGEIGTNSASAVTVRMLATFPNLKIGLLVGIGGGVPSQENDIRLGDVVVSIPTNGFGGVVQHDMGKNIMDNGWVQFGSLNGPPSVLRTTISKLRSLHQIHGHKIEFHLSEMVNRYPKLVDQFTRPRKCTDTLYEPEPDDMDTFEGWKEIIRPPRPSYDLIKVHYGLVASGNQVIKSGRWRDQISDRLGGVLCFEMEAAGLMNELPCVVIRGICDYADAHKHKEWQEHAAATAAAYAKELITALPTGLSRSSTLHGTVIDLTDATSNLALLQSQPLVSHWIVPFPRNKSFVGREQEVSTLLQWISSEDTPRSMAVFGLGGVGKTQLALEFAHCAKQRDPNLSVFWVPATDHLAFEQAYKQIGRALNIPGIEAHGADVKQLVRDVLSDDNALGPWLMVVDNADDIDMVFGQPIDHQVEASALIDYIPASPNGLTLFTTRNRRIAVKQAANNIIFLEMMCPEDARQLLEQSLLRKALLVDVEAVWRLLMLLGFLPLAIIQAIAYMNENDTTIDEYTDLYNDSETEVMKVLSEEFEVHGRYKTVKNSIATTWSVSITQITRTHPLAANLLSFMACMSGHGIPQSLLPPASSKKQFLEAIGALKAYSFIAKRETEPIFDIHPLVHLATRNWLRMGEGLQLWTNSATTRLVGLLPDGGYEARTTWTAYLPHAEFLLSSNKAEGESLVRVLLAEKLAKCLYSNGEYRKAHQAYNRALDLRVKLSGLENRDTLRDMFGIAEALNHQGSYRQAEIQHREVLSLRKQVLGPKDPDVGRSMNYLAQAMYDGGRYVEAEQMHREALELQTEVLHPEHPNALTTTGYLAQTLTQQGRHVEAEEMHRNLLKTRLRVMGEDNPATLATMSCLGVAQGNLGHYADAEETHRRVLDLRIRILGDRHPHTAITKRWLAETLLRQGKHEEALNFNQQALEVQVKLLGAKHPNTALTLGNFGDILFSEGQNVEAENVCRKVLSLQTELHGSEHPETIRSMRSLGDVLHAQGKHTEAQEVYASIAIDALEVESLERKALCKK